MTITLPTVDIDKLTTIEDAKDTIKQLLNLCATILTLCEKQEKEIGTLKEEIARLKGQPKKPTFSAAKNQSISVTKLIKKKKAWEKGSKKGKIPIDKEVKLPEVTECICGSHEFTILRTYHKIVQGILFIRNNIMYKGREKRCKNCGKKYKSKLPIEAFDQNLQALLSYWKFASRMTYPLLRRMLKGIGVSISNGQINEILLKNGEKLKNAYRHLKTQGIKKSPYLQSDASGAKRKDKQSGKIRNQYIQIISNTFLSLFFITKQYTAASLNSGLGTNGRKKKYVSDDGSPNGELLKILIKQLCWIHEIRHYKKLFPFFNPHQKLQNKILTQWSTFYHLAKHYGESPPEERPKKRRQIEKRFEQITGQTTGYDLLDKQLKLTKKKRNRLLTFLDHPELPIHNNQCEQDIREFVIMRKISGGTKSYRGDNSLIRHLSVIQTAQKQGLDVFQTLQGLLTGKLSPSVLTANIS
jgi:hypothetical protein